MKAKEIVIFKFNNGFRPCPEARLIGFDKAEGVDEQWKWREADGESGKVRVSDVEDDNT